MAIEKHDYKEPNKHFNPSAGCVQCGLPEYNFVHANSIKVDTLKYSIEIIWGNVTFVFDSFSAARRAGFCV